MDLLTIKKPEKKELLTMDLFEYINQEKINRVLASGLVVDTNQKQILYKYLKSMKNNLHRTKYINSTNSKYGRVRPKEELGTICMSRPIRNYLMEEYYDIDMRNCHVSILLSILTQSSMNKTDYETWMAYHQNRDDIISQFHETQDECLKDIDWKQYITSILYYGNHKEAKNSDFLGKLVNEIYSITKFLKEHNKTFYECVRRMKKPNEEGSFLALYLQEHEYLIMEEIMTFIYYECQPYIRYKGVNVMSYEYDGFKILKQNIPNIDEFLQIINDKIQQKYPYVEFVNKEMKEKLEVPETEIDEDHAKYERLSYLTDENIVDIIEEMEGENIIWNEKEWYYFDGKRWSQYEKVPHKLRDRMKKIVEAYFLTRVAMSNTMVWENYNSHIGSLELNKTRKNVLEMCKDRFCKKTIEFNTNENLFGFENGVYDLQQNEFREYRYDDYMTFSCGHEWQERDEEKIAFLMDILKKIHPDEKQLELDLTIRASGLCGKNVEKFILLNGCGRNGKGFEDTLQQEALGRDYCKTAEPTLLMNSIPESGLSPAHASLHLKRFVIVKEPKEYVKLDNSTIKSLTGGGELEARKCYSNDTRVRQTWTLVCECNDRPLLKERPGPAEMSRWIDIHHKSYFGDDVLEDDPINHRYVPNVDLKTPTFQKDYALSFIHILLDHFLIWKKNNYVFQLTREVKKRTQEYMMDCNPIHQLFINNYEKKIMKSGNTTINNYPKVLIRHIYETINEAPEVRILTKIEKLQLTQKNIIKYLKDREIEVHTNEKYPYIIGYMECNAPERRPQPTSYIVGQTEQEEESDED
jgi:phage/plasmid-associated DNA primase